MARDKEKLKAYRAAYYAANKEKEKADNATYRATNKEEIKAYKAAYRAANKEKLNAYTVAYGRLRNTGVTQEQYDGAYLKQKGVCAICSGVEASGKGLAADHCHTTGIFRGLLCGNCNRGLGTFKDNTDLLTKAIGYLNATKNV
jgi:polyphosphate kinase 2 (PPK2 family)